MYSKGDTRIPHDKHPWRAFFIATTSIVLLFFIGSEHTAPVEQHFA